MAQEDGEVLRSPALVLGEVAVRPHRRRRRRVLSGTRAKEVLSHHLHGLLRRVPAGWLDAYLRYLCAWVMAAASVPGNRLLEVCRWIAVLAARRGFRHEPHGIYRAFVLNVLTSLRLGVRLWHRGPDAVLDRIRLEPEDRRRLADLCARHPGAVLAVPHNPGAVLSALPVSRLLPTLLVSRNSPSVERTRMALGFYERMGVRVLMVRDGKPLTLARHCLRALARHELVVATVDRIDRQPTRLLVPCFGTRVGFSPWAARIAVHAGAPLVPTTVAAVGGGLRIRVGATLFPPTGEEGMRQLVAALETAILGDPGTWSFLADRRWRWVLEDGVRGEARSQGGVRDPRGASS